MMTRRFRRTMLAASLATVLAVMGGCTPPAGSDSIADASAAPLTGTEWRLTEVMGVPAVPTKGDRQPQIMFHEEGFRFEGFTGCNNMSGQYEHDGSELRLAGAVAMTRMACLESALNEQEKKLAMALESMNRYRITGNQLTIFGKEGQLARFEAGAPAAEDAAKP